MSSFAGSTFFKNPHVLCAATAAAVISFPQLAKEPYLNDVNTIIQILDPLPLVCILAQFIVLNPRNLPYYVCIWVTPHHRADVI